MPLFRSDAVLTGAEFGGSANAEVVDLTITRIGNLSFVYAITNNPDAGLLQLNLSSQGNLQVGDNWFEPGEAPGGYYYVPRSVGGTTGLGTLNIDGQTFVVGADNFETASGTPYGQGIHLFTAGADGSLSDGSFFDRSGTVQSYIATVETSSDDFIFEVRDSGGATNDVLAMDRLNGSSGAFVSTFTLVSSVAEDVYLAGTVGSNMMFFYLDETSRAVQWMSFSTSGIGLFQGEITGTRGFSASRAPTDLELVRAGGVSHLITSNPLAGLYSYEVNDSGLNVLPISASDQQAEGASQIATFQFGGRGFVAAADEQLTIYEIGSDGAFFEMDSDTLTTADINDIEVTIRGSVAYVVVAAEDGLHTFNFTPGQAQNVNGTAAANVIRGDSRDNVLNGYAGNDKLYGVDGDDRLNGGKGADFIVAGRGDDRVYGADDNDRLYGQDGEDWMYGGNGSDFLVGGRNNDLLYGGSGNDRLYGQDARDVLYGGTGNDRLYGGPGNDRLFGGSGGDWIIDGAGSDQMYGGANGDRFIITKDGNLDRISDWSRADVIDLRSYGRDLDYEDLRISERSDGTLMVIAEGDRLILDSSIDLKLYHIDAGEFIFA